MGITRHWHKLRGNKAAKRPVHHLFVDIETRLRPQPDGTTVHELWLGWCCYWRRRTDKTSDTMIWTYFETADRFWETVALYLKDDRPLHMVSHNVKYDFSILGLFDRMEGMGYTLRPPYFEGMTSIATFTNGKRKMVLLDNANYFRCPLADLGASIGFDKKDVDPLTASKEEVVPYCRRDVDIMLQAWHFLYDFQQEHNLGNWGRTISSMSMNAYRHRFMDCEIVIHTHAKTTKLERASYHGGRTSAFVQAELTEGPYYKLDVNSMYPFMMRNQELPRSFYKYIDKPGLHTLKYYLKRFAVIARVTLLSEEPVYPVKHKGHLLHPTGRFDATLTTPELVYALAHGHVREVFAMAVYRKAVLFRSFVDFFFGLKTQYSKEGDTVKRALAKNFLNHMSGKWGQYSWSWEQTDDPLLEDYAIDVKSNLTTGERYMVYRFGSTCWRKTRTGEGYNAFPAIIAHITAYSRLYLWELLTIAGNGHYFYCDTDSLIVDQTGFENLKPYIDEDKLGGLKVEEVQDSIDIRCPKVYRMGDSWKRKGVPSRAVEVEPDTWAFDMFPSFLTQGQWPKGVSFHTTRHTRHLSYVIFDGDVHANGRITPIDARDLATHESLPLHVILQVAKLETLRDALRENRPVAHSVCFTLWNYRGGGWKRQKDRQGNLVPLEYSEWDTKATELGFSDLKELEEAVTVTMDMERQMATISERINTLLRFTPTTKTPQEMPF